MTTKKNKLKQTPQAKRLQKLVEKPPIRRIGFDLPDQLIKDFKIATSMDGTSMTAMFTKWMKEYCEDTKKYKGLKKLSN